MANEAFRTEIEKKYPSLLGKAARSRLAGIRLFCIECHGGSRTEAKKCALSECFLHPHRGKDWEQNETRE